MSFGIDFGRNEVKLVQLQQSAKGYHLINYGSEPVYDRERGFDPERVETKHLSAAMERLMKRLGITPRRLKEITTGLSNQLSSIRQMKMVNTEEEEELTAALQMEARKHIPMDGTDALMDYQIIGEDVREMDKLNVLLVASTQRNLESHLAMLKGLNIRPGIVDTEAIGMTNAYIIEHGLPEEGANVFLNIGAVSSTLVVWGRQAPFFTRDIQIGGHHFTKELAEKNEISYVEAEERKVGKDFNELTAKLTDSGSSEFSVSVAEHTIYDNLVDEIRRSLRFYIKESNESFFHKILLVGGSAAIPGLDQFISARLNVTAETYNPVAQLHHNLKEEVENPAKYAVAVGYAMRGALE